MGDVEIKLDFAATQIEQAKIVFGLDDQPEQRRISFSEVIKASTAETRCRSSGAASSCGSARNE
jgi:hypothetical protein